MISLLLVVYNVLLVSFCYQRTSNHDSYIIYPVLSATLLAFVFFLYFFFLV
ncbi:putative membrane protein [Vibrio harveyi]|nr:putative membrane protein [Vibrio harveyi]